MADAGDEGLELAPNYGLANQFYGRNAGVNLVGQLWPCYRLCMPRLENSSSFRLTEIEGLKISALIGFSDTYEPQDTLVVLMLLHGQTEWHRVFLDAGVGFWEKYSKEDAFVDFENLLRTDYGKNWNLIGEQITSAICLGEDKFHSQLSKFEFRTLRGELIYRYADAHDSESATILEMRPSQSQ